MSTKMIEGKEYYVSQVSERQAKVLTIVRKFEDLNDLGQMMFSFPCEEGVDRTIEAWNFAVTMDYERVK